MTECIFCKIVKGEIPAHRVYEDSDTLAFLDINPIAEGHTLVIPKKHATDVYDIEPRELAKVSETAKRVSTALTKALSLDGVNLLHASKEAAGQSVFHFHMHVIPRKQNDGVAGIWPVRHEYNGKHAEVAKQISKHI